MNWVLRRAAQENQIAALVPREQRAEASAFARAFDVDRRERYIRLLVYGFEIGRAAELSAVEPNL